MPERKYIVNSPHARVTDGKGRAIDLSDFVGREVKPRPRLSGGKVVVTVRSPVKGQRGQILVFASLQDYEAAIRRVFTPGGGGQSTA